MNFDLVPRVLRRVLFLTMHVSSGNLDSGESGESYEAEMVSAEIIQLGSTVVVMKKGDPYLGETGTVVDVTTQENASNMICQVDFGASNIREYLSSELIRTPRRPSSGIVGARLSCERCGSTLFFVEETFRIRGSEGHHGVEPDFRCSNCNHTMSLTHGRHLLESQIEAKTGITEKVTLDGDRRQVGGIA